MRAPLHQQISCLCKKWLPSCGVVVDGSSIDLSLENSPCRSGWHQTWLCVGVLPKIGIDREALLELVLGFGQAVTLQCANISTLNAHYCHHLADRFAHHVGSSGRVV